jgi:hypothetical protein
MIAAEVIALLRLERHPRAVGIARPFVTTPRVAGRNRR